MDTPLHFEITPHLVAERMTALAEHYHHVVVEAQLPPSDTWLDELANDLRFVADLVRCGDRDSYRNAIAWLAVLRRRAHDRGVPFLVITLDNYRTVVSWLYDAAAR